MAAVFQCAILLTGLSLLAAAPLTAEDRAAPKAAKSAGAGQRGRDSAALRLSACLPRSVRLTSRSIVGSIRPCCGFTRWAMWTMSYLGMRPWTRASVSHMLEEAGAASRMRMQGRPRTRRKDLRRADARAAQRHAKAPAWRTRATPRRVGLHRGARHQRHAAARQLSSRLDHHQRLRPSLPERLQ